MAKTAQEYVGAALGKFCAAADRMLEGELQDEEAARQGIVKQLSRIVSQCASNERYANAIIHAAMLAYASAVASEEEALAAIERGEEPKRRGRRRKIEEGG